MAAVLLRADVGTYWSVTVDASGRRARRACDPGRSRAARCRTTRALEPGHDLEHGPDPGEVGQLGAGCSTVSSTPIAAAVEGGDRRSCGITIPSPVVISSRRWSRRPSRSIADQLALEAVEPQRRPSRGHPADPVVVGRGAPQRRARAPRRAADGRGAPASSRPAPSAAPSGSGDRRASARRPDRQLERADLEAGRRPGRRSAVGRAVRQARLAGAVDPAGPARQGDGAVSPGPDRRQVDAPAATSPPSTAARSVPEPAEVAEILAVGDSTRPSPVLRRSRDRGPARARRLCSHIAGFGRRSGQFRPSAHEVAVVRPLAEVAAVGPALACRRGASGRGRGPTTPR